MHTTYRSAVFFFLAFMMIFSQMGGGSIQPATAAQADASPISGQVTDGYGNGVADALVRAVVINYQIFLPALIKSTTGNGQLMGTNPPAYGQNYFTVQTDANGYYQFDNLPDGRYILSAEKEGLSFSPLTYTLATSSASGPYNFAAVEIQTTLAPNAHQLSEAALAALLSVSGDGATYTFSTALPELTNIDVGDIFLGGITTITPDGFLRKVVNRYSDAGNLIFITEQADLESTFESLFVDVSQSLTPQDIKKITDIPGVKLVESPYKTKAGDFTFQMNSAVLHDEDGDLNTTDDQIIANGLLSINPTIECRIRIENFELKEFYYSSKSSVQSGFTISSAVSLSIPFAEHSLLPEPVVLGAIPVGPLVISPKLDLLAGISGNFTAGVSAEISNTTSLTSGLWFVAGETRDLRKFESNFSFEPPDFSASVSFEAFVGPKISASLYGVFSAYVKTGFALNLEIIPSGNPWLKLKGGLTASVGAEVQVPVVDLYLLDVQFISINQWWNLLSLAPNSNNPPYTPRNPHPLHQAVNQSTVMQLSWTGGDPDSDAVAYDVYFDSGDLPPITKVVDHQSASSFDPGILENSTTYSWQVVAFDEHGLSTSGPVWRFSTVSQNIDPAEMVLIPAGEFPMGCNYFDFLDPYFGSLCYYAAEPKHNIYLDSYWIDKYEVTNGQYELCVQAGVCAAPDDINSHHRFPYYGNAEFVNYPVIFVSWNDAATYCAWAGKRLPTEAEWEKAARGTTYGLYPWGNQASQYPETCSLANVSIYDSIQMQSFSCVDDTTAVGNYPAGASPYNVMDMAGNVNEWVNDWFDQEYYKNSPAVNPTGPETGTDKVARGGDWYNPTYYATFYRFYFEPLYSDRNIGFRCAKTDQP